MISPSLIGSYIGCVWLALSGSPIVTAPAIELPNSRSIAYRSAGFLMPRRWVSRSRWRPSSAYPPKKLLAAGDGAFSRTDPNDSVSVTGPGVYPSSPLKFDALPPGAAGNPADLLAMQTDLEPVSHQRASSAAGSPLSNVTLRVMPSDFSVRSSRVMYTVLRPASSR